MTARWLGRVRSSRSDQRRHGRRPVKSSTNTDEKRLWEYGLPSVYDREILYEEFMKSLGITQYRLA